MAYSNGTVLNFHNTLLRESDVNLLMGPHWLNDQIISFYLEYLEKNVYQNTRGLLFISPEVVQCLKFVSGQEMSIFLGPLNAKGKSFIFFPLNDNDEAKAGGNHWSLLVFSRPESTFYYYDSLHFGTSLKKSLRPFLFELAKAIDCPEFEVRGGECVKQNNSYDCGIHVIYNIECLARRALKHNSLDDDESTAADENPTKITNQKIRQKRQDLLNLIQKLGGKL
ncbi:sentrin-specific protease 8 [Contarinia nasturtii]|uniref:sentrin-specific protease 8 n=1 Tax=Contarinia nasturtii TaxID=265458 RepID=UPI0012D39736|nr:sentrin-specific protease 8 [Contarinia nasturtii]